MEKPVCPVCGTDLTGKTKNWGSRAEGDYIVYHCPTCAEYAGRDIEAMVYAPDWEPRAVGL